MVKEEIQLATNKMLSNKIKEQQKGLLNRKEMGVIQRDIFKETNAKMSVASTYSINIRGT